MKEKETRNLIIEKRRQGKSDQEIYNELTIHSINKKDLLKIIVGTATDENINKFKWVAHCVTSMLIMNLIFIFFVKYFSNSLPITVDGKFVILFAITIVLTYQIYQFKLDIFIAFAGLWAIYSAMQLRNIAGAELYISIILFMIILGLLFLYSNKMFPKFRIFGYRKDKKGEYVL